MLRSILGVVVIFLSSAVSANDHQVVYYDGVERDEYHISLLKHALSYFPEKHYLVKPQGTTLPKKRSLYLLETRGGVDVMVGTATKEREQKYLPVYFPILKGINGWRIPLISKETPKLFENITDMASLKTLKPGLFHTWTDVKILNSNQIDVVKGSNLPGVYKMLDKLRFDYFPQSAIQAFADLWVHRDLNLMLDPYVLIKYPNAYYFYVNKENHSLANDITAGLELALKDGSFDEMFNKHYGKILSKYEMNKRRVFELKNPLLVDNTQLERSELWAKPHDF